MIGEDKVKAVREYLQGELGSSAIRDHYEPGRKAQVFVVESAEGSHKAVVSYEFLQDHEAGAIPGVLKKFLLAEHLRECDDPILVTAKGLDLA
jgi:hypothetical protein